MRRALLTTCSLGVTLDAHSHRINSVLRLATRVEN
jgi:hypothetical protein